MPKTARRLTVHPPTLREVEVVRVVDLTPGMRRITLSGEQLREFTSANGFPQGYEDRYLERLAKFQSALAVSIAESELLAGVRQLVIHSGGAGAQAREFVAGHEDLCVTICALPAQADWLCRDLPATIPDEQQRARVSVIEQSVFEPSPASDAVFISRALKALPDPNAAHALRRAAESLLPGGRVLLIEDVFDTSALDEHDGEAALFGLTVHGSGLRTAAELDSMITRAGLVRTTTYTVGWGTTVHELVPVGTH